MKKYFLDILKSAKAIYESGTVTKVQLDDLSRHISYCQHERLVHLIVMVTFALLTIISLFILIVTELMSVMILFLIITILTAAYIGHYYFLENSTQKLYKLYDEILKLNIKE